MRKNNFLKVGLVGLFSLMLTIGVNKGIEVKEVKAEPTVASINNFSSTSGDIDDVISYKSYKGGGTTNPAANSGQIRLYQNSSGETGGFIVIEADAGYIITEASITSSMNTTTGYVLSNSSAITSKSEYVVSNYSLSDGDTYTVSNLSTQYITFGCFGTSKDTRLYVSALSITYELEQALEGTVTSIDLDSSTMPTEVYTGSQWDTSGIVVTASYDDNSTANVTTFSEITLNPEVAPLTTGETTVTVTASYETFSASKQFTVNVIEPTYYEKITSLAQLKIGSEYLIATDVNESEVFVMSSSFVNGRDDRREQIIPEVVDSKIVYEDSMELVTLEANGNNYSLKTKSGQYLSYSGDSNSLFNSNSAYAWSLISTQSGIEIACANSTTRTIQKNNSAEYFATYTSNQTAAYLYGIPSTEVTFDISQENSIIKIGDSIDLNVVITNVDNPVVNWSIDQDREIVSLNQNTGTEVTVNGLATGQATITATMVYDGETYTDSVVITVEEAPVYDVDFTSDVTSNPFNASGVNWAYYMDAGEISTFDDKKGLHFGTGSKPCGKVQLISDAFIAPETGETSIHRIDVEASNASRNNGGVELSVYVNDVKIGETKTISSASTMYSFETNEPLMGQIKIVLEDKSNDPAAMYIKGFEVYANVDETGTLLMPIVNALSQFKTCEIQAQDESFGTFLNSHQTTIEEHSNVLSGVKIYDYESEKTDYTGPKTFVTDFMSKYNLCLQRYNNVATSPVLQPMNSNNIIPIAIVMVAISSLMILSIGLVIRKRKSN